MIRFLLNHSNLKEIITNVEIKILTDENEIQKCIDLFNSEIIWDSMFNIQIALDRIKKGELLFAAYKNKNIFSYCWLQQRNNNEYYLYNVFSKKSNTLRKVGVIDLLYLVIKYYTKGTILVEIDEWNTQSQKVANKLGFNIIENS